MTRWLLLLIAGLAGCNHRDPARAATPLTDSLLGVAHAFGGPAVADDAWSRSELDRIAAEARAAIAGKSGAAARDALSATIFEKLAFVREVADTDLRFVFLPSVLKQRRGSCVGLGSLYLALGERLGWNIRGMMMPGHFFVRVSDHGAHGEQEGSHNLELLHRGEELPDAWYRQRFPIPGGAAREYGRALTSAEVLGVIEYDVGNERRRQRRWTEAQRAYELARKHFPDFAEAHASLGAVAQLLGKLDEARLAYEAAQRANPNLPGVNRNLSLLQSEHDISTRE